MTFSLKAAARSGGGGADGVAGAGAARAADAARDAPARPARERRWKAGAGEVLRRVDGHRKGQGYVDGGEVGR